MEGRKADMPVLLALGSRKFYASIRDQIHGVAPVAHLQFAHLNSTSLNALQPDFIIAPLFCPDIDCLDVGEALQSLGYQGCTLFVSDNLPNPAMIEKEIRQQVPALHFHILPRSSLRQLIARRFH